MVSYPNAEADRDLVEQWGTWAGVDEVGRGAWAGPVAVGVVAVDATSGPGPAGLADSKNLSANKRQLLVEPIKRWAAAHCVGWASPREVEGLGLTSALGLAGARAIRIVELNLAHSAGGPLGGILLDGNHNWLAREDVVTRVKADASSQVVAAASILAKVARDQWMQTIHDEGYEWYSNKGYASSSHRAALEKLGLSAQHRATWNIPGLRQSAVQPELGKFDLG